ncbi:hypothetical protein NL676_021303 [Syzygium grande]|nr:hypothetical protein NL676_021303 [Syzygium grande]
MMRVFFCPPVLPFWCMLVRVNLLTSMPRVGRCLALALAFAMEELRRRNHRPARPDPTRKGGETVRRSGSGLH